MQAPSGSLVLVTGATGFTGGHLALRLADTGHRVRALVRDSSRCELLMRRGVEITVGDLCDPQSLQAATDSVSCVYHLAGVFREENVARKEMRNVNVAGTENLLEASVRSGVERFVHVSTAGVHGDVQNPPAAEDAPYSPGDVYQRTKLEGEKIALRYMREGRISMTVVRPAGIYGPLDFRFLKLIKAIQKRIFIKIGSGEVSYQMVYIDDLIDGLLLCGSLEQAIGRIYILTGERANTLNEIYTAIAEMLEVPPPRLRVPFAPVYLAGFACELLCRPFGIHPPLYRRRVDFFRKNRSFDISRAQRELGFKPMTSLSDGMRRTAAWYRENGYL